MIRKISVLCCSLLFLSLLFISCSEDEGGSEIVIEPKFFFGDITLATQDEVNAFGAEKYTRVTGSLFIGTEQTRFSVVSLAPLISLTSVRGILIVSGNERLPNLEGLNNLVTIEGEGRSGTATDKSIFEGPSLNNIDALSSLKTVNKGLIINGFNNNISSINGLSSLEIVGRLFITRINMTNLDPLMNLNSVDELVIGGNNLLTNIDGLSNLNSPVGKISMVSNDLLNDFCGIRHVFLEYGEIDAANYNVGGNAYNPSQQDIIDGNCSL